MKKLNLLILLALLVPVVYSGIPIYVKPIIGGALQASSTFTYQFNFTLDENCTDVVWNSSPISMTTGTDGIAFTELNATFTTMPNYLCEYRDNVLRQTHNFSVQVFYNILARELSASIFNWYIADGISQNYLSFNGSHASFSEAALNLTVDSKTEGFVNKTGDTMTGNLEIRTNLTLGGSLKINGYRITDQTSNDNIVDNLSVIKFNRGGTEMSIVGFQGGGAGQASWIGGSLMLVDRNQSILNSDNASDCTTWFTHEGIEQKIDCNTTSPDNPLGTGPDIALFGDIQVSGEGWFRDTDGEWHFFSRELELLDELRDETVISRINSTVTGDNLTIYDRQEKTLVVNIEENTTILGKTEASIDLLEGTNTSPNFIHVYYEGASSPSLTQSLTEQEEKADVAQLKYGGNYSFGDIISSSQSYEFIRNVYHRFYDDGAIYISGFAINVTDTVVNISTGTMKVMLSKTDISENHSTDTKSIHIHSDGTFEQHIGLDDLDTYGNGIAIGNNKYFNVVFGIVHTSDATGRLYAIVQNKPTTEYTSTINAEIDSQNTINLFPSDSLIKKLFIPIARVVIKNTGGTMTTQTLSNGQSFFDLRGTVTTSGGSSPTPGITAHSDLTNLLWSTAGHTIDTLLDLAGNDLLTTGEAYVDDLTAGTKVSIGNHSDNLTITALAADFAYFDQTYGHAFNINKVLKSYFGSTGLVLVQEYALSLAGKGSMVFQQHNVGADTLTIGTPSNDEPSNILLVTEYGDTGYDRQLSNRTDPTLCITSNQQTLDEMMCMTHNTTNSVIKSYLGDIILESNVRIDTDLVVGNNITANLICDSNGCIGSGASSSENIFNQSLNTTDPVVFATINSTTSMTLDSSTISSWSEINVSLGNVGNFTDLNATTTMTLGASTISNWGELNASASVSSENIFNQTLNTTDDVNFKSVTTTQNITQGNFVIFNENNGVVIEG